MVLKIIFEFYILHQSKICGTSTRDNPKILLDKSTTDNFLTRLFSIGLNLKTNSDLELLMRCQFQR